MPNLTSRTQKATIDSTDELYVINSSGVSEWRAPASGLPFLASNGDGSSLTGLTKAQVGLGNVNNTSDANKPISTATQSALNDKLDQIGSSTDNGIVRFDGTAGAVQDSGVLVGDNDEISGYKADINEQTGTAYTLQASDSGKIVECDNASPFTLTLPETLPAGFIVTIVPKGAGAVTMTLGGGGTLNGGVADISTSSQYEAVALYVSSNAGTAPAYIAGNK